MGLNGKSTIYLIVLMFLAFHLSCADGKRGTLPATQTREELRNRLLEDYITAVDEGRVDDSYSLLSREFKGAMPVDTYRGLLVSFAFGRPFEVMKVVINDEKGEDYAHVYVTMPGGIEKGSPYRFDFVDEGGSVMISGYRRLAKWFDTDDPKISGGGTSHEKAMEDMLQNLKNKEETQ